MHEAYAGLAIRSYPDVKKEYNCFKCDLTFKRRSALKVRFVRFLLLMDIL